MAFFSFFKKTRAFVLTDTLLIPAKATPDAVNAELVMDLLKTPLEYRDRPWERTFYDDIRTAAFAYGTPEMTVSPEGYSFIHLQAVSAEHPSGVYCIENLIPDSLLNKGFGIRIHSSSGEILWECSYGEVLNFYLNQEFLTREPSNAIQHIDMTKRVQVLKKGDEVMIAQPSEKYLPSIARNAIRSLLYKTGFANPKIMLLCRKFNGEFIQQLAFHLVANQMTAEQHDTTMQKLTWYLPRHYSVISFHEGCDTLKYFETL